MADGNAYAGRRPCRPESRHRTRRGLAGWSAADIIDALADGTLPQGGTLGGEMGEVVANSTSRLRPEDREAIALYLKSLPPKPTEVKKKKK